MKKAKILLTAITVLAVVGGAFAFKAQSFNGTYFCSDVPGPICPEPNTTTIEGQGPLKFCTTDPDFDCTTTTYANFDL